MEILVSVLILFALTGFFARFTDVFERKKGYVRLSYLSALIYSVCGALLASVSPPYGAIVFGIVIGVLFAGKVDSRQHQLAVGVMVLAALFLNFSMLVVPLVCFSAASFLDEDLHDRVSASKKRGKGSTLPSFLGWRLLLELASLVLSISTGMWFYFAGVVAFDAGYLSLGLLGKKWTGSD